MLVGVPVGVPVGLAVGVSVGLAVAPDPASPDDAASARACASSGMSVGEAVGVSVGEAVGVSVGEAVGDVTVAPAGPAQASTIAAVVAMATTARLALRRPVTRTTVDPKPPTNIETADDKLATCETAVTQVKLRAE